jgi:hypothetical protein
MEFICKMAVLTERGMFGGDTGGNDILITCILLEFKHCQMILCTNIPRKPF